MWFKFCWFKLTSLLGLWPLWCKTYQWLWERKLIAEFGGYDSPGLSDPDRVAESLALLEWRPDGWRELWDAAHHPAFVASAELKIIEKGVSDGGILAIKPGVGQPKGSMDCEDFALAAAAELAPFYEPLVLCIYWSTGRWPWQVKGHAVCMFNDTEGFGYCGNWPMVRDLPSAAAVVDDILERSGKTRRDLVSVRDYEPSQLMYRPRPKTKQATR